MKNIFFYINDIKFFFFSFVIINILSEYYSQIDIEIVVRGKGNQTWSKHEYKHKNISTRIYYLYTI